MKVPLIGGSYTGRSSNISPSSAINWFVERNKEGESLVSTPGATALCTPTAGEVRGGIEYNGLAYFVIGNTLYEVNSGGGYTSRGTIGTSSGRVSMAHNGTRTGANQQIMIVDGVSGYIYDNTTSTLSQISDADFPGASTVVFLDGYFVFSQPDTDRFWITSLYDGTAIDENDFATAEGDPDTLQAVATDKRDLFLMGHNTFEVWYNSGDADNTFQRFQGGHIQTGLAAPHAISRFDNTLAFLTRNTRGQGQVAVMAEGYNPRIISTPEVNYQISTYSTIDDAFSYTYQHEGHEFYVLTFPTAKRTWAYDAATQEWHERAHTISGVFPNREAYNCHVFAFGKHLFGDVSTGMIYQLDSTIGTVNDVRVPRVRITPQLTNEEKRIRISQFQLDMQEGIGDPNVSTDTSMWLSYSKDGGHTFSNEIEADMGDAGEYSTRVIWRRLGHARNWVFKLRTWSPNPMVLKGAYVKVYGKEPGEK